MKSGYRIHSGVCHGTLGELYQGPHADARGKPSIAIISLPIRRYSYAHFFADSISPAAAPATDKEKSEHARRLYIHHHRLQAPRGYWTYDSELLSAKGMASSTADIVATIRCLDSIFGNRTSETVIAKILGNIERSDSVFLDEYALYLSEKQKLVSSFACRLGLWAAFIDEGSGISTEGTAGLLLTHYSKHARSYARTLQTMVDAFRHGHREQICASATDSARMSQDVLPKHHFDALQQHQAEFGADGIVVAHTGSLIGYLFVRKPPAALMGELASFFKSRGHRCQFVQTGVH